MKKENKERILDCPFCGEQPTRTIGMDIRGKTYPAVVCSCKTFRGLRISIDLWNKRSL